MPESIDPGVAMHVDSASYLAGSHVVTGYYEALEVLRHNKMRTTVHPDQIPVMGDSLSTLHAAEHIFRRRIMNHLVRPDALEWYRHEITLPTLIQRLRNLRDHPDPDGKYRIDLVRFSKETFLRFAATLVGLDASTDQAIAEVEGLLGELELLDHARFTGLEPDTYRPGAISAAKRLRTQYLGPAIDRCPISADGESGTSRPSLVALLASKKDPAWADLDVSTREVIAAMLGAVDTSTGLVVNATDDLHRWFKLHPEDAARRLDLDFLARAIQESLRIHPPLPHFVKEAAEDLTLVTTGLTVSKGQRIAVAMYPANTDPTVFGADAEEFNLYRDLSPTIPRYGLSFGAGQHQCIGLRIVLGNEGVGSHAHILRTYLRAGVVPDPARRPVVEPGTRNMFRTYPSVLENLDSIELPE